MIKAIWNIAAGFFNKTTLIQLKKYLITGVLSVGLEMLILFMLTNYKNVWYIASNTAAVFIVFWFNFLMNRFWSFKSGDNFLRQLLLYGILFFINMGASNGIMYVLTDIIKFHYLFSKVFAVGAIACWNFVLYKKIIYRY